MADIIAGAGQGVVTGTAAADRIFANRLTPTVSINGLGGSDDVVIPFARSSFKITVVPDGVSTVSGASNSLFLSNVERVVFSDQTVTLGSAPPAPANSPPTGTVTVSGTARQGETVIAASTLADADGLGAIAYRWQSSANGAVWVNIAGASGVSLTLGAGEVGRFVRVVASYTDGGGAQETVVSGASAVVETSNDAPTGSVNVDGLAQQGETLAATNNLADADGLGVIAYEWQSSVNGALWTAIAGASGASLTLGADEVGRLVRVVARYTDGGGTEEVVASGASVAVLALPPGGGDDVLAGGPGNDTLDGGPGADTMTGARGNDVYVVDNVGDSVVEAPGQGSDTVRTTLAAYTLGSNVERLAYTASGGFAGTGNGLANVIDGGGGDDALRGEGGNDTLRGNAGNDSLIGGTGADLMAGGAGDDRYEIDNAADRVVELPDEGSDTLLVGIGAWSMATLVNVENMNYVGSGNFAGTGNLLANTLTGGDARDRLSGLAGDDTLIGNGDNDVLDGGPGDDRLDPGDGDDAVIGGTGNDRFIGGAGADRFDGGPGDDTLALVGLGWLAARKGVPDVAGAFAVSRPDATTLTLTDLASGQRLTVKGAWGSTSADRGIENFVFADASLSLDQLIADTASAFKDTFNGSDGDDLFDGLAGDDLISGGGGGDQLAGGPGNDTMDGGSGKDTMSGGPGNDLLIVDDAGDSVVELPNQGRDTLRTALPSYVLAAGVSIERIEFSGNGDFSGSGNELANLISAGGGNDTLFGDAGADTLLGGDGNDSLDGGSGADRLDGGLGDDTYVVDHPLDLIVADPGGSDTVRSSVTRALGAGLDDLVLDGSANIGGSGNADANRITGNDGNNVLAGAGGNDTLIGGAGDDTLVGGAGDDVLIGGLGRDLLNGNGGADRFVFDLLPADPGQADLVNGFVGSTASAAAQAAGVDTIVLVGTAFAALQWTAGGTLVDGQFVADASLVAGVPVAVEADDRLLYDLKGGRLYYDADGSGGDAVAQLIAVFGSGAAHPALAAADFAVA